MLDNLILNDFIFFSSIETSPLIKIVIVDFVTNFSTASLCCSYCLIPQSVVFERSFNDPFLIFSESTNRFRMVETT